MLVEIVLLHIGRLDGTTIIIAIQFQHNIKLQGVKFVKSYATAATTTAATTTATTTASQKTEKLMRIKRTFPKHLFWVLGLLHLSSKEEQQQR